MSAQSAIVLHKLLKRFNDFTAVNGIDLEIKKGEIFGLLGPNGAGKSTTINMILGLIKPTSGSITVEDIDMINKQELGKAHIGIVSQETLIEPELTAAQNIVLFGRLYHVSENKIDEKVDELLNLAELTDFKDKYAGTFSGGMQRRLAVVRALVHDPDIILLDEPTNGLDVQNRVKLWELLRHINETRNVTVLITTQYLEEADNLCNRIAIIDHGKIIALGTSSQLKQSIGKGNVIDISANKELIPRIEKLMKDMGLESAKGTGNKVMANIGTDPMKKINKLLGILEKNKIHIDGISMHEPTLDDVFLKLTGTSMRDAVETSSKNDRWLAGGRHGMM
jgi:ABC-2 type transport system ATP-binding protein